jgi:SAM-dependent methyltransferase
LARIKTVALHVLVENLIHALRYREVRPHLAPCENLLDLGCGAEYRFLRRFHGLARNSFGMDLEAPDSATGNLRLSRGDITRRLPFGDASMDVVTVLAVLEHLTDPTSVLREVHRVLRPGGRVIVTTPSALGIRVHDVLRRLRLIRDVEEGEHQDFDMTKERLESWARGVGLEVRTAYAFECRLNLLVVAVKPG